MATIDIDFSRLSLQDALDLAVLIEEEARERYEEFAHQMRLHHTHEAARFFRFMARNEEKHRVELAARRRVLFGVVHPRVKREMLFEVEAPEYDEVRAFMTARQALDAALRAEEKAYAFFVAALPAIRDEKVRKLFEELRDEEVHHQELVRAQMASAPPDPALAPEHFVDEPVEQ
ncbi:MAG TPA: ferritin family protein [Myxococcales bacterium]|nr:ferritin family protein [Myxococcales bacterium]